MATRVGKYVWEIDPDKMPMDEFKCLKDYIDNTFTAREQEQEIWLDRMYELIDEAKEAGFQFTIFAPCSLVNLTAHKQDINVKIKEGWV